MESKKIAKNYMYNTMYQIVALIAPLITTPYVSRVLGVTGIGVYNYTRSIATYFVLIGAVGTTLYGQREIAYMQNNPERFSQVFWEINIFRFITVGLCFIIYFFTFGMSSEYAVVYRILGLEVLATAFDISWFYMGLEKFRITVIRNTLIKLIGIALVFVLVKSEEDVALYTVCLTLPILIGNLSLWVSLPKYIVKTKINVSNILRRIAPILILFLPQIATEVYTVLNKTMLGAMGTSMDEVGYYTQSDKIIKCVLMVITSLGTVMLPAMSFAFKQGKTNQIISSIKKAFKFTFMLGFALLFGLCGVAKNFVPVFFGKGYNQVVSLMVIISPVLILIGISNVLGKQYLLPTKRQKFYTVSVVAGATINILLNIALIPKFDAIGASIATVVAELAVTSVQCFAVRKLLPLKEMFLSGVKYLVSGLIMGISVYLIGYFLGSGIIVLVIQIVAGGIIYLMTLFITKDPFIKEGILLLRRK